MANQSETKTLTRDRASVTIPEQIIQERDPLEAVKMPIVSRWGPLRRRIEDATYGWDVETIRGDDDLNTAWVEASEYEADDPLIAGKLTHCVEINRGGANISEMKMRYWDAAGQNSLDELLGKRQIKLLVGMERRILGRGANVVPSTTDLGGATGTDAGGKVAGIDTWAGNGYIDQTASGDTLRKELPNVSTGALARAYAYGGGRKWDGSATVNHVPTAGAGRMLDNEILKRMAENLSELEIEHNVIYLSQLQQSNFSAIKGAATDVTRVQNQEGGDRVSDVIRSYENAFTGGVLDLVSSPNFKSTRYKTRAVANNASRDATTLYFIDESDWEFGYIMPWEVEEYNKTGGYYKGVVKCAFTYKPGNPDGTGFVRDLLELPLTT